MVLRILCSFLCTSGIYEPFRMVFHAEHSLHAVTADDKQRIRNLKCRGTAFAGYEILSVIKIRRGDRRQFTVIDLVSRRIALSVAAVFSG